MNSLICPSLIFQRLLRTLAENRRRVIFARAGIFRTKTDYEWLIRDIGFSPPRTRDAVFRIALTPDPLSSLLSDLSSELIPPVIGHLYLGEGAWRGHGWGVVRNGKTIQPLEQLLLVGPGMHRIQLSDPYHRRSVIDSSLQLPQTFQTRWSRTIGALGGETIWKRLIRLKAAIVGCGRTGSLVAATLARLGIRNLTLIDPDIIETHNLGEMDAVTDDDIGRSKAEAISDYLRSLLKPRLSPVLSGVEESEASHRVFFSCEPILAPITDPIALSAAKECDVLFCCADNDAARLATAILATLYHKILIDIGTGIFFRESANPRIMGADIRLILPGDGCLLCRGNLTNYAQAMDDLCNPQLLERLRSEHWTQQRAGSLRTLNQLAASLGVQMLQDLVADRIQNTTWAHIEFDETGHMTVTYPGISETPGTSTCTLCVKSGLGDEGLGTEM